MVVRPARSVHSTTEIPPIAGILLLTAALVQAPMPARRPLIAVTLVGGASGAPLEALAPILRETFGAEIVVAPELPLPPSAYNSERRQYLSTRLLDLLASRKRPQWERLLGIAGVDLYVPDLNFVFGEADSRRGVAVFSLSRLRAGADEAFCFAAPRRRPSTSSATPTGCPTARIRTA